MLRYHRKEPHVWLFGGPAVGDPVRREGDLDHPHIWLSVLPSEVKAGSLVSCLQIVCHLDKSFSFSLASVISEVLPTLSS